MHLRSKGRFLILLLPFLSGFIGSLPQRQAAGWTEKELRVIQSLWLGSLPPLPPDPSNRVADDSMAARLGKKLFFDPRLSSNGKVSCATCHQPNRYYTDGLPRSLGTDTAGRHAPSILGTAYNSWFYWDGRRDKQWSQALTPLETVGEQEGTRTQIVALIQKDSSYRRVFESVFGPMPPIPAYPPASPRGVESARQAWSKIPPHEQRLVNQLFANAGKCIAAYERQLQYSPSRFDRYAEALARSPHSAPDLLSEAEVRGLSLFMSEKAQCLRCHNGPLLTNFGFHAIGIPGKAGRFPDLGRSIGIQALDLDEFRCDGPYSDAAPEACEELRFMSREGGTGAFKVPSLRNVAHTAPYMHDGSMATLNEVLRHYRRAPRSATGAQELNPLPLSDADLADLEAFLRAL